MCRVMSDVDSMSWDTASYMEEGAAAVTEEELEAVYARATAARDVYVEEMARGAWVKGLVTNAPFTILQDTEGRRRRGTCAGQLRSPTHPARPSPSPFP